MVYNQIHGASPGLDRPQNETIPPASEKLHGYFGESSAFKFVTGTREEMPPPSISSSASAAASSQGVTNQMSALSPEDQRICQRLPSRAQADQLVDSYFERVHLLYPFLHEPSFRHRYERMWDNNEFFSLSWLAVVNIIFAHGYEFCPQTEPGVSIPGASIYLKRAKSILLSQVFSNVDLELTQAFLLLCHYLQGALELNECWNIFGLTIRSAITLGLHISTHSGDDLSPATAEAKKRLWWGCFILDRTLSMKFGRTPSIALTTALDVDFPVDVDDQYIMDNTRTPRQPSGRPSRITLFVQTIRLSFVIDNILQSLYLRPGKRHRKAQTETTIKDEHEILGNIIHLDGQLQSWWDTIPVHLRSTSTCLDGMDQQRQRNVIYLRYLQMRLLLLRPALSLLSKDVIQNEYLRAVATASADQCVAMACETVERIRRQYPQQLLHSVWYLLHYMFSSLGVILMAQTLGLWKDGNVPEAPEVTSLKCGMDFLRSSSQHSIIARRYVSMLEQYQRTSGQPSTWQSIAAPNSEAAKDPIAVSMLPSQLLEDSDIVPILASEPRADLDGFAGVGGMGEFGFQDPNDLLFGNGLPHEFSL